MIRSFRDKITAALFLGKPPQRVPPDVRKRAREKLDMIDAATTIDALRIPPGNRLEALQGSRFGQWSVRVNDQWRICFRYVDGDAWDVELCDYH
ncbi:MAG TPA: type II toxin-antitoxin system RelE/ParE family toxin [Plasticicumulans sp.]|nr:type II toxin-antitoxin system RelE/ParE family toxin [Plasticicumulans sp.]